MLSAGHTLLMETRHRPRVDDLLATYPARADVPWDDIEGRIVIALPRKSGAVERFLARILPVPENVVLSLEGTAASFWRLAEGTRTLRQMAAELAAQIEGGQREARVLHLARDLAARGFLVLRPTPEPLVETRRGLGPEKGFHPLACRACKVVTPVRARSGARWFCPRCRKLNMVPRPPPGP